MVPRNSHEGVTAKDVDALIRFRAIPHHVAKQPESVEPSPSIRILKHCVKGPQVGVHIRKQQNSAHHGYYTTPPADL